MVPPLGFESLVLAPHYVGLSLFSLYLPTSTSELSGTKESYVPSETAQVQLLAAASYFNVGMEVPIYEEVPVCECYCS
eukprot:gene10906-7564_t